MAARTDIKSANTELAQIKAKFAKFVAAHNKTGTVLRMLQHGLRKQPAHRCRDANANSDAHACINAHTHMPDWRQTLPFFLPWTCTSCTNHIHFWQCIYFH